MSKFIRLEYLLTGFLIHSYCTGADTDTCHPIVISGNFQFNCIQAMQNFRTLGNSIVEEKVRVGERLERNTINNGLFMCLAEKQTWVSPKNV